MVSEDATCETEGCKGFGTPSSQHCPEHTCPERDCKSSSKGNQYCDARRRLAPTMDGIVRCLTRQPRPLRIGALPESESVEEEPEGP